MNWLAQMEARRLVLSLRELLVRFDENLAANTLMRDCVPYILEGDPEIARARSEQAQMVDHIVGESYAGYYETNHHERPFEEQYGVAAADAHNYLHRCRFLRAWLESRLPQVPVDAPDWAGAPASTTVLDVACNDGWLGENLEGLCLYTGIDLNPHCLKRAQGRLPGAKFLRGFAEDAVKLTGKLRPKAGYDAVVAYELIEHVRDPDAVLGAMVACCKPGGSLFISTPLGACTGGDLPNWWYVEPKGHVRAFTAQHFGALLDRHGEVQEIQVSNAGAGQLMVAHVLTAVGDGS